MSRYSYHPALKEPGDWSAIPFADPDFQPAVRMLVRDLEEKTANFEPPAGIRLSKKVFSAANPDRFFAYVFEPAEEKSICANLLYCHGGGFYLPIQPMMMKLASQLAKSLAVRVYLPEYRLLPEYTNPTAFLDCRTVLEEIAGRDLPYLLYGESVGATLAAGLSLFARSEGLKPALGQFLIYPVLDNTFSQYPSMRQYSEAAWPLRTHIRMWSQYKASGFQLDEAYLVPMKAADFRLLPKAYIEPQEMDILHDEAVLYAEKLHNAGVEVIVADIAGSYHGFDEDLENPFVQNIVQKRINLMEKLLHAEGEKFNDD